MSLLERLAALVASGERGVLFTVVEGDGAGANMLVLDGGETIGEGWDEAIRQASELIHEGRNRLLTLDDGSKVFAEVYGPPPRLFVYGAVDTAEALCIGAKLLGWAAIVADARGAFATRERIPSAAELIVAWPEEAFGAGAAGSPDRGRRPHSRRQVRRAGARRRARQPRVLRRCAGPAPESGAATRAVARGRSGRGRPRPHHGALRSRHRRRDAGGDRAFRSWP